MKKYYVGMTLLVCAQHPVAQLLTGQHGLTSINTAVINPVTREIDKTAERLKRDSDRRLQELQPALNKTVDNISGSVDALAQLPQKLPILSTAGKPVFVDVEVEQGARAVEYEWLATVNAQELTILQQLPVDIQETTRFSELDVTLVRFRVPPEWDSRNELQKKLPADLFAKLDRNHIYSAQLFQTQKNQQQENNVDKERDLKNNSTFDVPARIPICTDTISIGMVDTAVNRQHPAFMLANKNNTIKTQTFIETELQQPDAHGTAIAGLFIGKGDNIIPLVPNASLYVASVFYARSDYTQGATMMNLVRALNWLVGEHVSVINMSLAGPDNNILATVIAKIIAGGGIIVAAAGNEGPAAPPVFPAAYPGVIAVTAVDSNQHIYRWANRGNYIYFSAPGVSVITARSDGSFGRESGTSMAAPVVAAHIGCELIQQKTPAAVLKNLRAQAIDLGEPGRDDIYGYGLIK